MAGAAASEKVGQAAAAAIPTSTAETLAVAAAAVVVAAAAAATDQIVVLRGAHAYARGLIILSMCCLWVCCMSMHNENAVALAMHALCVSCQPSQLTP